jgi:hypothetical protein
MIVAYKQYICNAGLVPPFAFDSYKQRPQDILFLQSGFRRKMQGQHREQTKAADKTEN